MIGDNLLERIGTKTPVDGSKPLLFLFLYLAANAYDAATTLYGINMGLVAEGNPLILGLFGSHGILCATAVKLTVALAVGLALYGLRAYLVCRWALYAFACVYGFFVVYQSIYFIALESEVLVSLLFTLVVVDVFATLALLWRAR